MLYMVIERFKDGDGTAIGIAHGLREPARSPYQGNEGSGNVTFDSIQVFTRSAHRSENRDPELIATKDSTAKTPLAMAIEARRVSIAKMLLKSGAPPVPDRNWDLGRGACDNGSA